MPDLTVRENIILALAGRTRLDPPDPAGQRDALVAKYIKALDIRPADPERGGRIAAAAATSRRCCWPAG